ncbi:hypothetical protein M3686_04790 [Micrococcus luteus]|uniref:hypothetical protein n=1 Tax=Micrococcus luteus TaxID=1270 RepID=UPI00203D0AD7|nr:hypothetical protein [Micrococcus luteus]MCM3577451.1 hypothetical protein [Micrococcus luteus]
MANKSAILSVRIVSDSKDFGKGFQDAESRVARFESNTKKLGSSMESLAAPAAVMGTAVAGGFMLAGQMAAEAEQNVGAVETVFGSAADSVIAWSQDSANAAGMSTSAYQALASSIGGSLGSAYESQDQVAQKTRELIGASADLASVFGGDASEAAGAMGAALRGEFDSLERFGIFLNMNAVNAEMAKTGQDKLTGAALDAAKKQTIQNMIMEQAAKYQGNFAREADTTAGAQQRATAAAQNAAVTLGNALLPYLTMAATALAGVATWASQNVDVLLILGAVILGLAGAVLAVNAAMSVYRTIVTIATAAQAAWNMVMAANPIGLIVLALAALVAAVVLAYNRVAWFRDGVDAAFAWVQQAVAAAAAFFATAWTNGTQLVEAAVAALATYFAFQLDAVQTAARVVTAIFSGDWDTAFSEVQGFVSRWQGHFQSAQEFVQAAARAVADFFRGAWEGAVGHTRGLIDGWGSFLGDIFGRIEGAVRGVTDFFRTAWEGAVGHVRGLIDGIASAASSVGGVLGLTGSIDGGPSWVRPSWDVPADGRPFLLTAAGAGLTAPTALGSTRPVVTPTVVNINVSAGVGDPVEIGREVDRVLRRFREVVGA